MTIRNQCERLYRQAFGESQEFDPMLFDLFFKNTEVSQKDGIVTAMYFKIPCVLNFDGTKSKAYYIYAVTTHNDYRHQGIMSNLIEKTQTESDSLYFLKPSSLDVIPFYNQAGFKQIVGTREICNAKIEVSDNFNRLSELCDKPNCDYPLMIKGTINIEKLTFEYTLE